MLAVSVLVAVYKRSTVPVYKAHGLAQATMSDCVSETFSAIRTVRSFSGEKRQMSLFGSQILAFQRSGLKLGPRARKHVWRSTWKFRCYREDQFHFKCSGHR